MEEFRINILIAAVLVGTLLVGCSSKGSTNINENSVSDTISVSQGSDLVSSAEDETKSSDSEYSTYDSDSEQSSNTGSSSTSSSTEISENTSGVLDTSDMFSTRDLTQEADTSAAKDITVSDGKTIDITEEGVYVISGSAKNCTIKVSADKEAKVQLVLDGVSITNDSTPAIYVVSADKCFVTTTSSENTLTVTGSFTADGDTNTDAVIFSKDDIVLNGVGTLNITSTDNGISGKDDLKITGGTYNITSTADAIEANDSIRICGGTFNISTSKDALHSENDDDDTQGFIYISGGNFTINASSDAIQGTTAVQIDGGTAVEVCRNNDFDIIIMDIMMPDMDGFTACKKYVNSRIYLFLCCLREALNTTSFSVLRWVSTTMLLSRFHQKNLWRELKLSSADTVLQNRQKVSV